MRSSSDQAQIAARIILLVRSSRATSRRSLADQTRLSPTTAGMYVDQLIANGLIHESGLERGAMGRPKRLLTIRAEAGWFAGVELNAERAHAVAVDFSGQVKGSRMLPLPPDADADIVMNLLVDLLRALKKQVAPTTPLLGIGIGAPGVVEPIQGLAVHYSFIRGWENVPVADLLNRTFDVPVTVENNLRAIALAERWYGGGRDLQDYVILGPRSGFGVALVHEGRLIHGSRWAAGEIGRWPWPLDGSGGGQELHDVLSAPVVYRRLAGLSSVLPLPEDLRSALTGMADTEGDMWDQIVRDYGRLIGCLHLLMDAEVYLLHGPLTALGMRFCEDITRAAKQVCPAISADSLRMEPSTLGDDAGALGAASLAMEAWTPTEVG